MKEEGIELCGSEFGIRNALEASASYTSIPGSGYAKCATRLRLLALLLSFPLVAGKSRM